MKRYDSVSSSHTYTATGIYTVTLTVTDKDGDSGQSLFDEHVVVYDPSGGFVNGSGRIYSEVGADQQNPPAEGKAIFRFGLKYKKRATVPSGNTVFRFKIGLLDFSSTEYEWLVIDDGSSRARVKGSGTVNGGGDYKFLLWVGDDEPDTFRIKTWQEGESGLEVVRYDNGYDGSGYENGQPIAGGTIAVHTKK